MTYEYLYKIIILGDSSTGKSTYLKRIISGDKADTEIQSTVGVDFRSKIYDINGKKIKMHIWDTAGQEIYHSIVSCYYRQAIGVLLFVDMTKPLTFKRAEKWVDDLRFHFDREKIEDALKVMVVANKHDLAVSTAEFIRWIEGTGFDYRIISTKDDTIAKIEDPIISLAKKIDNAWPDGCHSNIKKHSPIQLTVRKRSFCKIL